MFNENSYCIPIRSEIEEFQINVPNNSIIRPIDLETIKKKTQFSTMIVRPDFPMLNGYGRRLFRVVVTPPKTDGFFRILSVTYAPTSIVLRVRRCLISDPNARRPAHLQQTRVTVRKIDFCLKTFWVRHAVRTGLISGKKFADGRIILRKRYLLRAKTIRSITGLSVIIYLTILSIIGPNSWRKLLCGRRLEELKRQQLF